MSSLPAPIPLRPPRERSTLDDVVELYKQGIDRSLVRESLRRTPEERLRALMELQRLAEELRRAGTRR